MPYAFAPFERMYAGHIDKYGLMETVEAMFLIPIEVRFWSMEVVVWNDTEENNATWELKKGHVDDDLTNNENFRKKAGGIGNVAALNVLHVNGSNPDNGDGSSINPFKTLQLARDYVIGAGSADDPERPNQTIVVDPSNYLVSDNLIIRDTTYLFKPKAIVFYDGTGYLFDATIFTVTDYQPIIFNVFGMGEFQSASGGIMRIANANSEFRATFNFEFFMVMSGAQDVPVFNVAGLDSYLWLQPHRFIMSNYSHAIFVDRGGVHVEGGSIVVHAGLIEASYPEYKSNICCVKAERAQSIVLNNVTLSAEHVFSMIDLGMWQFENSVFREFVLNNVTLNIGVEVYQLLSLYNVNMGLDGYFDTEFEPYFLINNLVHTGREFAPGYYAINYSSNGEDAPLTFNNLQLTNSYLKADIDPNIDLEAAATHSGKNLTFVNIINGRVRVSGVPTYDNEAAAASLGKGDIYYNKKRGGITLKGLPETMVREKTIEVSAGVLALDFEGHQQLDAVSQNTVSTDFAVTMANASQARIFAHGLSVSGTVIITFPSNFKSDDMRWNGTNKSLTLSEGTYEVVAKYIVGLSGGFWSLKITGGLV